MNESVFIETTIPSYYVARRSRDIIQAARQELTIQWWEERRKDYRLFSSAIVVAEVAQGDPESSAGRLKLLEEVPLLPINHRVLELAKELLSARIVPAKASDDPHREPSQLAPDRRMLRSTGHPNASNLYP